MKDIRYRHNFAHGPSKWVYREVPDDWTDDELAASLDGSRKYPGGGYRGVEFEDAEITVERLQKWVEREERAAAYHASEAERLRERIRTAEASAPSS